jgi:hypothetical protein
MRVLVMARRLGEVIYILRVDRFGHQSRRLAKSLPVSLCGSEWPNIYEKSGCSVCSISAYSYKKNSKIGLWVAPAISAA